MHAGDKNMKKQSLTEWTLLLINSNLNVNGFLHCRQPYCEFVEYINTVRDWRW